jgi:hypothetical protein
MTTEELKRDFETARIKHVHFKTKVRSFLFGNAVDERALRDPVKCSLGAWIADRMRGAGAYAYLPEARLFDQQHHLIHQRANQLMDLHLAGRTEEAGASFALLQVLADEMVVLLQTMEAKLRTET